MKKIASTRIPAEQANAFNALGLPEINSQKLVEVVRSRPQSKQDWRRTVGKNASQSSVKVPVTPSEDEIARQNLIEKAREAAALEGYTEGLEKGRQSGFDQGYAEGKSQSKQELASVKQQLSAVINAIQQPLAEQQELLIEALSHVVVNISEAVIHRELNEPESIQYIVAKAIQALPVGTGNTSLKLHPDDCKNLNSDDLDLSFDIEIVADKKLNRGDCRLQSNQSVVDYTTSSRFKQAIAQMFDQTESLSERDYAPQSADIVSDAKEVGDETTS